MWKIIIKFVGQVLQQKERAKFFLSIFCYTATSQEVGAFRPLRVNSILKLYVHPSLLHQFIADFVELSVFHTI